MTNNNNQKLKPIVIRNPKAIELIQQRAELEGRTKTNALERTVLEALGKQGQKSFEDTSKGSKVQR